MNLEDRFWKKVLKGNGCWLWQGGKTVRGYGTIRIAGRDGYAHRASWIIHYGPIPSGQYVCHTCDNPTCVNPSHLFLGTQKDNIQDMVNKGRHRSVTSPETLLRGDAHPSRIYPERLARGENHGRAKLNDEKVREVFRLTRLGRSQRSIARLFGVDKLVISLVIRRKTWRHVNVDGI